MTTTTPNPQPIATEDLRNQVNNLAPWHSPHDFGNGIVTKNASAFRRFARRLKLFQLPSDLSGKRVLDVGTWDGYFAFELESRGAEVVAIDIWDGEDGGSAFKQFQLVHQIKKSKVVFHRMDVHAVSAEVLGEFDVVLCAGVLYHCRHPLLALESLRSVTKGLLILETVSLIPGAHGGSPMILFFPGDDEAVASNRSWGPCAAATLSWIKEALLSAGYDRVEHKYRPSMALWKKFVALLTNKPGYGRSVTHAWR